MTTRRAPVTQLPDDVRATVALIRRATKLSSELRGLVSQVSAGRCGRPPALVTESRRRLAELVTRLDDEWRVGQPHMSSTNEKDFK